VGSDSYADNERRKLVRRIDRHVSKKLEQKSNKLRLLIKAPERLTVPLARDEAGKRGCRAAPTTQDPVDKVPKEWRDTLRQRCWPCEIVVNISQFRCEIFTTKKAPAKSNQSESLRFG
jgi:hypothetical protein